MQEEFPDRIVIHPADYEDISTVDAKLVHLAQEINATLPIPVYPESATTRG